MWCRLRHFDCILLVFFRRWGRLVMRDLIKHDALLWLVVFQQLWLVHFDPCCSLSDLLPRRSAVARLSCCCVFWSWASTLLEFLFRYPCWCCQDAFLYELPLWPCACGNEGHDRLYFGPEWLVSGVVGMLWNGGGISTGGSDASIVLLNSVLHRPSSLSDVHLAVFTGNLVSYAIFFSRVDSVFWSY